MNTSYKEYRRLCAVLSQEIISEEIEIISKEMWNDTPEELKLLDMEYLYKQAAKIASLKLSNSDKPQSEVVPW